MWISDNESHLLPENQVVEHSKDDAPETKPASVDENHQQETGMMG